LFPLRQVDRFRSLPLSFAQWRLWFFNNLEPENHSYNFPFYLLLNGPLNLPVLKQVTREITRRHEVLRTTFGLVEGEPVQVIAPEQEVALEITDLREIAAGEREERAREVARQEARRPFDLSQGPLLRVRLLRLQEQEHVLLLSMHHIVCDGWSQGIFIRELSTLYEAFQAGRPSPLPELPIQYADYAVWQREWLQGEALQGEVAYWKEQLGGAPPLLELPTDHPRPAVQSFRGAQLEVGLGAELSQRLKALSQAEGVTLFMTLLAAFQLLLSRYSGQRDIVVGSPIAGRNRSEIEGLIGFFVNTLALRTDLSGDPTFRQLLQRVRATAMGAYAHQDMPFEKLVEELQPERSLGHQPLFQVMLVLQNAPTAALRLPGLELSPWPVESDTSKFDLTLWLSEGPGGLRGALEYSTDLFERATMERLSEHWRRLLEGIVAQPEARVSELPLLGEDERRRMLEEWNQTEREWEPRCLHELFEGQAETRPEATALVWEQEQVSYGELNRRANQLAHHLRGLGVGPEVGVGLCVERSVEMVVGLLGILKAGGFYVPLDPSYPRGRLGWMLEDAGVRVLLTQRGLREELPENHAEVLCLDSDWERIATAPQSNPHSGVRPANLAYLIYTSGSTGLPKGVMGSHREIVNVLRWMWERYPFGYGEICCQKTSLSFVDSVWELFGPLLQARPIVLIAEEEMKDSIRLMKNMA
jgi:non-ribosomal peptide synthetase component F